MSLTPQDVDRLKAIPRAERAAVIKEQIHRVHHAVHAGTLDKATVTDALDRLTVLTDSDDEPDPQPQPAPTTQSTINPTQGPRRRPPPSDDANDY